MSTVDWVIAVACALWVIKGFMRGFIGEAMSLLGWLVGLSMGSRLGSRVGFMTYAVGVPESASGVVGFFLVLCGCLIVSAILSKLIRMILGSVNLGGLDKITGAATGMLKGVILAFAILWVGLQISPWVEPSWMENSVAMRIAYKHLDSAKLLLGTVRISMDGNVRPHPLPDFLKTPKHEI